MMMGVIQGEDIVYLIVHIADGEGFKFRSVVKIEEKET